MVILWHAQLHNGILAPTMGFVFTLFAMHYIMAFEWHSMRWLTAIEINLWRGKEVTTSIQNHLIASNLSWAQNGWVSECVNKQEPIMCNLNSICYVSIDRILLQLYCLCVREKSSLPTSEAPIQAQKYKWIEIFAEVERNAFKILIHTMECIFFLDFMILRSIFWLPEIGRGRVNAEAVLFYSIPSFIITILNADYYWSKAIFR